MNIRILFNLTATLIAFLGCSCNNRNENKTDSNLSYEELQEIKRDSVISMFKNSSGQEFKFIPQDTVLVLPADINVRLHKNSFLTSDSAIYNGYVNLNIEFITDSTNQLFSYYVKKWEDESELKGILKIEVKDENGKDLILNPNMLFTPKFGIMLSVSQISNDGNYWRKDSLSKNAFYQLVVFDELQNQIRKEREKEDKAGKITNLSFSAHFLPDGMFVPNAWDKNTWDKGEKIQYKGHAITKIHAIAIELGKVAYQISPPEDWARNKYDTYRINVELVTDVEDFNPKVMMYKHDMTNKNAFYNSRRVTDKEFKIVDRHLSSQLHLLVDKKYTIFAFFIKDERIYFAKTSPIKLDLTTNVSLKMEEMSFDKTISQIRELKRD